MKGYTKKMKIDVLRTCGFGRKSARHDEVKALTNLENEKGIDVEDTKKQIESYKKIIREKKFTAGYRQSCKEAVESLEAISKAENGKIVREAEGGYVREIPILLKTHQETGTTMSKSRLKEIKERGKMEKTIQLNVKIRPMIIIYMGKTKLGTIEFDNIKEIGKFTSELEKSIRQIIKNMKGE